MKTNKSIYLSGHKEAVIEKALERNVYEYFDKAIILQAIEFNCKNELRYNPRTGQTYKKSMGLVSEYCNKKDIPNYSSTEEAAIWEFTGFVRNSASMIKNGYKEY